jgi:prepilin-type N-terminal cleavage/methylation domain-containing protein/prepilin-type processing-associated H-X9-DG protein
MSCSIHRGSSAGSIGPAACRLIPWFLLGWSAADRGFTVVELLTVLGILALVLAVLIPAVQAARESSRHVVCTNHLRQIGLALNAYHGVNRCFPMAALNGLYPESFKGGWGWHVAILPFVDQQPLFDTLQPNGPSGFLRDYFERHGTIVAGSETVLPVYRCPSSGQPPRTIDHGWRLYGQPQYPYRLGYGSTDYKGCTEFHSLMVPQGSQCPLGCNEYTVEKNRRYCLRGCSFRLKHVQDGASQTLAAGESGHPGEHDQATSASVGITGTAFDVGFITRLPINSTVITSDTRGERRPQHGAAYSEHPGGAQFLFVDGSVHFLGEGIDKATSVALGTIDTLDVVKDF